MTEALEEHELAVLNDSTALAQQPVCDIDTVKQAQSGDEEAFTQLFMQTYRAMYFTAKKTLTNDEDVYDALQIGYTKAYKYITRLSAPEKFYPWLHTIIQNAALDVLKDVLAYAADEFTETADEKDAHADAERRADLRRLLASMDEARAQVLTLHYYDGLSLAEIARMLGQPASTVRSRLRAAKNELRALLEQSNIDENLYGGSLSAMIVTSLRSLIGTDILSAVVAQDMLDNILAGKTGRLEQAVYKMLARDRDHRIKHLAATLLAVCVGVAALTTAGVFALIGERSQHTPPAAPSGAVSSSNTSSTDTTTSSTTLLSTTTSGRTASKNPSSSATATTKADTFVPDYREGHANTVGNNPNNLSLYSGRMAKQDNWLYYYDYGYLYKIKTDGSGYQLLAELTSGCTYINVIGDWIYYNSNGVRRMRTDGSEEKIISTRACSFLFVSENTGYYIPDKTDTLYRFDTDDLKPYKHFTFTDERLGQTAIYNNQLIYLSYNDNSRAQMLVVRDLSSPNEIKLQSPVSDYAQNSFFINDHTLYVMTKGVLSSIDLSKNDPPIQKIADTPSSDPLQEATVLYYSPYNGGIFATVNGVGHDGYDLHLYNINGVKLNTLSGNVDSSGLHTEFYTFNDDNIYYFRDWKFYKAKADMSDSALLHE